jgi:uncharacterized protein (TIGR02145 family)
MKKTILVVALISTIISCKKETTTPTTSGNTNTTVDTTPQTVTSPLINSLDCSSVTVTGTLKKGVEANSVSVNISYFGGNGKSYIAQTVSSSGVIGLTAKLSAGTLVNGDGTVTYLITGTPSTTGTANFAINLCGKSCSFSLDVVVPTSGYGPTITDVDGNTYKTVYIGTQQWMAENLRTAKYNDGSEIRNYTANTDWQNYINMKVPAFTNYNNDAENSKYGKLYNWFAVSPTRNGDKNICPTGWHVPTDGEWTVLTDYLGGDYVSGGKMVEVASWRDKIPEATNSSLFSALPGGYRDDNGNYGNNGIEGHWWSSTEAYTNDAWFRLLRYNYGYSVRKYNIVNTYWLSVRCLRD